MNTRKERLEVAELGQSVGACDLFLQKVVPLNIERKR